MSSPFEDGDARYLVVVNGEGQHALWPTFADVPAGWRRVHGADRLAPCLAYIERNWTDQRPLSRMRPPERRGR